MIDKKNLKFISVQSKINAETAQRLDRIVERGKFASRYELLQYILSAFLRYADPEHEVNEDEEDAKAFNEVASMFEGWEDATNRIITTRPSMYGANKKLIFSVYVYSEIGKRLHLVRNIKPGTSTSYINSSIFYTLDEIFKTLHPTLWQRLSAFGASMGEKTSARIISKLMDELPAPTEMTIAEVFDRHSSTPEYGNVPKQKRNRRTIENM